MKKFIVINGKDYFTYHAPSLEDAITKAENICDHSLEVIIREVN